VLPKGEPSPSPPQDVGGLGLFYHAAEIIEAILAGLTDFRAECKQTDGVTFVVIKALQIGTTASAQRVSRELAR
jgi:hypothetical protein